MVGRRASLDGRLFFGGTDGSNPVPTSGESVSQRELAWQGREAGLFAQMCGPCQATESAETGMAGRHRTTGDECLCWAKFQYRGAGDGSKLIAASCRRLAGFNPSPTVHPTLPSH